MNNLRRDLLNPTLKDVLENFCLDKTYTVGQGSYLIDDKGIRYLDFIAQYGSVPFGYNPDFIWERLEMVRQAGIPSLCQPSLPAEALKLANMLAELTPGDLCYSTFCQSGTEAVEAAIKLARSTTGRALIVSTTNSFHGKTLGALSATGKSSYQEPFRAPAPGFVRVPYNDIEALQDVFKAHDGEIAAFIVEPVQGEGGIIVAQPGYLRDAQALCREHGAVFIVDEIQTGLGRTGRLFACEHDGIEPDVLLLAKALGGGLLPMGVCISSPRVWNDDFGMLHSSTFANNNVTCAVGQAVLERLLEDDQALIKDVKRKGSYMLEQLELIADRCPGVVKEVRGQGLMMGLEFNELGDCGSYDMSYLVDQGGFSALLTGFLLNCYHIRLAPYLNNSMTLRLEPALTIEDEAMDRVLQAVDDICRIMANKDYGRLYRYLIGDTAIPGKIVDYRSKHRQTRYSKLNNDEAPSRKFAFIIHYPGPEDVVLNNPSFDAYSREELFRFMEWESRAAEPGVVCHLPSIRSLDGTVAEGWLIGVPYGGREIMGSCREEAVEAIRKAVDIGRDLGAGIIGLGALTSVVTRGGRSALGRGVAITSGNSFTTLMAMEALAAGAGKMKINLEQARGAVVGATGSIGRACAVMLSEQIANITLLGNPAHVKSSQNRLNSLAADLLSWAWQRCQQGNLSGLAAWLDSALKTGARISSALTRDLKNHLTLGQPVSYKMLQEWCDGLGQRCPLHLSLDVEATLPDCQLVVAASNSPEYLIFPHHLRSGAVVCDVARPADVAPETIASRRDVLVLEGGLVQLPDQVAFGANLGYRDGVTLACLSETMLLALEGDYQDYSIGNNLSLSTVTYLRGLAAKHGFGLAGLKMGNDELDEDDIAAIYQNSLVTLKKAGSL
jgi:acetylornithine/succinyldiaminopimelate/putrescine aminotransferase/predicted amino acid dehydrogenase